MKQKILAIAAELKKGAITTNIAFSQILELTERIYNGVAVTGTAKVKDDSNYIYAGHTFPITGIYHIHKGGRVFPDGSKDYYLSLIGSKFEERNGKKQEYTVIHEKHLEIIEINVVDLNEE